MSKSPDAFAQILQEIVDATGDTNLIEDVFDMLDERDELLGRLGDFNNLNELKQFEELEGTIPKKEAELLGTIKIKRAESESTLIMAKVVGPLRLNQDVERERQWYINYNQNWRELTRNLNSLGQPTDDLRINPERDRKHFNLRRQLHNRTYELNMKNLRNVIKSYNRIWRRYQLRKAKLYLLRHLWKIFWSLIIFTILIGALTSQVSIWYLSIIIIPTLDIIKIHEIWNRSRDDTASAGCADHNRFPSRGHECVRATSAICLSQCGSV